MERLILAKSRRQRLNDNERYLYFHATPSHFSKPQSRGRNIVDMTFTFIDIELFWGRAGQDD